MVIGHANANSTTINWKMIVFFSLTRFSASLIAVFSAVLCFLYSYGIVLYCMVVPVLCVYIKIIYNCTMYIFSSICLLRLYTYKKLVL